MKNFGFIDKTCLFLVEWMKNLGGVSLIVDWPVPWIRYLDFHQHIPTNTCDFQPQKGGIFTNWSCEFVLPMGPQNCETDPKHNWLLGGAVEVQWRCKNIEKKQKKSGYSPDNERYPKTMLSRSQHDLLLRWILHIYVSLIAHHGVFIYEYIYICSI